jgi:hypothetical protein
MLTRVAGSPDAYPQKLDLNAWMVLVVVLDAATYRGASFLDDRVLGPATQGAWVPLAEVFESARRLSRERPLHFIFHTGHVGSTLVSRLLDATGAVLSLREPLPLRTLADARDSLERPDSLLSAAQFDNVLALFMRLWSRGYEATRSVVVKATSSAGRLAVPLLAAGEGPRALYMNLRAEPYLATLLAGANSPSDLRGHGPERMRRLQSRLAAPLLPLHALSIGELAALSWLAETWTQREALERFPGRILAVDFDRLLASPGDAMARILDHLGLAAEARELTDLAQSPVLARYSKAPEHVYSPEVRAEVLRESRQDNRAEIGKGMAWLEARARADPAVAAVLAAAA